VNTPPGHEDCSTCTKGGPRTTLLPIENRPADPVAFSDPAAWGFCFICAYMVARNKETGLLMYHGYRQGPDEMRECPGTGREPTLQSGPEAKPVKLVSLHKSIRHLNARKKRHQEMVRERAVQALAGKCETVTIHTPASVNLVNLETGERTDVTDAIIGPITLEESTDGCTD
jgi:hypothetical protein